MNVYESKIDFVLIQIATSLQKQHGVTSASVVTDRWKAMRGLCCPISDNCCQRIC